MRLGSVRAGDIVRDRRHVRNRVERLPRELVVRGLVNGSTRRVKAGDVRESGGATRGPAMADDPMRWWHGNTVRCQGCQLLFPALDDVCQVVTVKGDPCDWHRGFLDPITQQGSADDQ